MDDVELVNPVGVENVEPWLACLVTTLLGDPYGDDFRIRVDRWTRDWTADRVWGARDRGRWVATLATDERTLMVPAVGTATTEITVDALTAVTVSATHRPRDC